MDTETHRGNVKMEAEVNLRPLQAEEHPRLPANHQKRRTGMAWTVSHSPEETRPADTLVWDFKSEAIHSCYFSHPVPVRATLANECNGCKQQGNSMLGLWTQGDNGQRWCSEDLRQVWKLEMKASGKAKAGEVEWLGHLWECGLHSQRSSRKMRLKCRKDRYFLRVWRKDEKYNYNNYVDDSIYHLLKSYSMSVTVSSQLTQGKSLQSTMVNFVCHLRGCWFWTRFTFKSVKSG